MEVAEAVYAALRDNDTSLLSHWDVDVRSTEEVDMDWVYDARVTRQDVDAWCSADDMAAYEAQSRYHFACVIPEYNSLLCDIKVSSVCFNQCSGKGLCDRGFCVCEPGYHGVDCSIPVHPARVEVHLGVKTIPAPGGRGVHIAGAGEAASRSLLSSIPPPSQPETSPTPSSSLSPSLLSSPSPRSSSSESSRPAYSSPARSHRLVRKALQQRAPRSQGLGPPPAGDEGPPLGHNPVLTNGLEDDSLGDSGDSKKASNGSDTASATSDGGGGAGASSDGASESSGSNSGTTGGASDQGRSSPLAKRPRIYVYELPPVFNTRVLQFRRPALCTSRIFLSTPAPSLPGFNEWEYSFDYLFLEWLLHSEHRTLDPDEADYFYVPFLMSCYIYLAEDFPRHRLLYGDHHSVAAAQAVKLILQHIRSHYPYWDSSNGTDHIWMWTWDEGSAGAPAVIRNSVLLTSWGARYVEPRTGYGPSMYIRQEPFRNHPWLSGMAFQDVAVTWDSHDWTKFNSRGVTWAGDVEERGDAPGYDPDKDIAYPGPLYGWLMVSQHSLYRRWLQGREAFEWGVRPCPSSDCPKYNQEFLFYFAGDLGREAHQRAGVSGGRPEPHYSWGVRQTLARHYLGEAGRSQGIYLVAGHSDHYFEDLSRSIFCGALPGDGWSQGFVRALLHGCIPVMIMDDVDPWFSNVIDATQISLRVRERDIPHLHRILASVPRGTIHQMQANIRRVWPRFVYARYRREMVDRMAGLGWDVELMRQELVEWSSPAMGGEGLGSDALDTILEWLYVRLRRRELQGELRR
eukprot:jgi/Mesvir1/475/Mv11350-RA.1